MAQKTKVKELVGRGLNSYHTKALQQIDRIKKKNKEQNHKISILSNELDNDYLTKTEEGSIVSLEHSKEGMIYLDELQGNTLVNYCTDGSKEMTLNGDIDVEGTSVTLTEGVDNGLVDVVCEGNTLVNIANHPNAFTVTKTEGQTYRQYDVPLLYPLKPETTYTIYLTIDKNEFDHNPFTSIVIGKGNTDDNWSYRIFWNKEFGKTNTDKGLGRHKAIFTTHSRIGETNFKVIKFIFETFQEYNTTIKDIVILEGNYSNNQDMFLGMKSVGECEDNKIEILSRNKNLFDLRTWEGKISNNAGSINFENNTITINGLTDDTYTPTGATGSQICSLDQRKCLIKVKPNTSYTLSMQVEGDANRINYIQEYDDNYNSLGLHNYGNSTSDMKTFTTKPNCKYIGFRIGVRETGKTLIYSNIQFEENSVKTNYVKHLLNKKEILINEPLRALPNGTKDRLVKIGNRWYIERNCCLILLDGITNSGCVRTSQIQFNTDRTRVKYSLKNDSVKDRSVILCNKLPQISDVPGAPSDLDGIATSVTNWKIMLNLPVSLVGETDDTMNIYLRNNNLEIVAELATPIYEPLEIEPTLNTYNDITHISNNSIIPCNMKIQNSGYNAIIKPSTLYTIALDTNKSGTIGMNLGGAKGTTTNNVLTLTTPATLTDDSLRLYGKGIKGSKVRLLEGDKTNWIPSHFEGMKSSFEDKLQDDGTYKMEILSNKGGMNLCTNSDDIRGSVASGIILEKVDDKGYKNVAKLSGNLSANWFSVSSGLVTKISPNTTVTISVLARTDKPNNKSKLNFYLGDYQPGDYVDFNEPLSNEYKWVSQTRKFISNSFRPHFGLLNFNGHSVYISKMKIEFGNKMTEWCPSIEDASWSEYKNYNKIQFSSIEPLRGVGDVKDRFVFKDDGKLMIERNCGEVVLNGGATGEVYADGDNYTQFNIKFDKHNTNSWYLLNKDFVNVKFTNSINSEAIALHYQKLIVLKLNNNKATTMSELNEWLKDNPIVGVYQLAEPTYEEIPFELQKIILEGYENGTLFFDTNIPPTSTVTYAGETPIVSAIKSNKSNVVSNTNDINDNIIPYLMDMDYRVVCLQLQSENINDGVSMARLFGGAYEMLQRDILSKRYSVDEYKHRLDAYLDANKITEEEYNKLGDMLNE